MKIRRISNKCKLAIIVFVLLLTLTSCGEKKYKENIVTAKSCFSDTTISLTCKCELIPSTENVVFFLSNSTLSEMKEMIEDATIYDDTLDSQVTFIKDGCYFVLKEKFSDKIKNKYVLSSDYAQIVVETGVKHYTIPFPQYICPVYYVESDIISLEYKNVLTKYYNNLKGFTIESTESKIVIKHVINSIDNTYANICVNFGDSITITSVGE